jgi:arsenate reductase-like glutaredoxin family protein
MIKDTSTFNVNSPEETDGSKEEQELYQSELGNIETNLADKWNDLGQVKQTLWKKLNGDKEMKKEKEKREVRLA